MKQDWFVRVKFSRCKNKTKIEFMDNGDAVRKSVQSERSELIAKQKEMAQKKERERIRLAKEQRKKNEHLMIERLKRNLRRWEENYNFPSSEQIPLNEKELKMQYNQSLPKSEYRGITQIYIAKIAEYDYYVGATSKGYPKRLVEHCEGHKSNITNSLEYGSDEWEKNLLAEVMEYVQPLNKKCGWCDKHANVLEHWMQERIREVGLSHSKGNNTQLPHGEKCQKCNDLATKYGIQWKS